MASATGKSKFDVFIDEKYRTLDAKVNWAVFAAALLVPALLFYFFFFKPQSEKIAALEKQVATATAELNKVKQAARDLPRHKQEFEAVQQQFEAMAVLLPKSQEIPDLLRNISDPRSVGPASASRSRTPRPAPAGRSPRQVRDGR